ncbi:MAG TPA: 3'-5' exonuclease [Nevskiaceae bacterium]|nr:3'-5' exonuclease [Nevskiaceae bacterium]
MTHPPTLVFDIETVPDLDGARRILGMESANDDAVAAAMTTIRRAEKGTDFQPAHLQRVVAISCCLRAGEAFRCWSIGDETAGEEELIQRFFDGIEKYRPTLVTWNGGGFDLPVLHYRALIHGVKAQAYWDTGLFDRESKFNNYLKRYEFRHTDLMDVLALYTGRQNAPLHEIALLLGLPGKIGMDGSQVFGAWRAGRLAEIRAYCETDVMNTWLVYLRFQAMRGHLSDDEYESEILRAREFLETSDAPHWAEFAANWNE